MQQLRSLHAATACGDVPEGVRVDLRAMQLTHLALSEHAVKGTPRGWRGGELAWLENQPIYEALHLPTSLVTLSLLCLPQPAFNLPHLTALTCTASLTRLRPSEVTQLAWHAPVLVCLEVKHLELDTTCHAAPFPVLARLVASERCALEDGCRVAIMFPALRELHITSDGHEGSCREVDEELMYDADGAPALDPGPTGTSRIQLAPVCGSFFDGANALEVLDVGSHAPHHEAIKQLRGLCLQQHDFAVLAALPKLRHLRLDATAEHSSHLAALTRITSMALVVLPNRHKWARAFKSNAAPVHLRRLAVEPMVLKVSDEEHDEEHYEELDDYRRRCDMLHDHDTVRFCHGAIDAVVMWIMQAPALSHLCWDHKPRHRSGYSADLKLTDVRQFMLMHHPSITHIEIVPDRPGEPKTMLQRASPGTQFVKCT